MAIIKCKMCGGDMEVNEGTNVAECEYCGTKQTVPHVDDEKKLTLFSRANRLRLACEFDKAAAVYENLVTEFPKEAEAYWGLVLCKYGIEYVDDPATGKKVPTCHRSSFESILEDSDFEQACENADVVARKVYREEAKFIEQIRQGILEVSGKEQPYDIFICYKETDDNGQRTLDSVMAQDVYDALTQKGYRVFFSRITLEDKLGTQYEPYIFAALNSAKVMLVFGTDYEYLNAVWVKNEWSRFLKLMEKDKGKHLIPCYKNIDAYDMPKEFQKLQAQDMGKVGAMQDLLRGIDKLLSSGHKEEQIKETVVVQQTSGATWETLMERGRMFLEDKDWKNANIYFDKVLDIDPQHAEAYVGKLCAKYHCETDEKLQDLNVDVSKDPDFTKAVRFASADLKENLEKWNQIICDRLEQAEAERRKKLERIEAVRKRRNLIGCGYFHMIGLNSDGTIRRYGSNSHGQLNTDRWSNIVAVSGGQYHSAALRADGTVVAVGDNTDNECNVSKWSDITAIECCISRTVGLKSDGTVVAVGSNRDGECNVRNWSDIIAIACGLSQTVGLKSNGKVVVAAGNDYFHQSYAESWSNIVAIACGDCQVIGLKLDGTVVAKGRNYDGECAVGKWSDIVGIACGDTHTVGLKSDGTVVAVGCNLEGQCNVSDWTDIVAISCGCNYTVGLKSDGTIIHTKEPKRLSDWKLFENVDTLEEEWKTTKEKWEKAKQEQAERKKVQELREKEQQRKDREMRRLDLVYNLHRLQAELPNVKGMFANMKRKHIEAEIKRIESLLSQMKSEDEKSQAAVSKPEQEM